MLTYRHVSLNPLGEVPKLLLAALSHMVQAGATRRSRDHQDRPEIRPKRTDFISGIAHQMDKHVDEAA